MYLYGLKLWNFRKYGSDEEIDLLNPDLNITFNHGLNLLIGENDSGKTAIIDAIKLILKTSSDNWVYINDMDFYKSSDSLRIEVLFRDFSESEGMNFIEYYTEKEFNCGNEQILNLILTATRKRGRIFTSDVKTGFGDSTKPLPSEVRDLLKVTYLKPLRDVKSELIPKKNSRLSQIFESHDAFSGKDGHVLVELYESFNKSIKNYFDGKDSEGNILSKDQKGKELKESMDRTIADFFDEKSRTDIETTPAEMKKILESLRLSILDIDNPGLGSLNRLFMATELIHLNKENWNGLRLGLIEEIEAHLHPQVQLKVIKSLLKQKDTQLILTSHSPNLASKVPLRNQIICRNNLAYSLSEEHTNLDKENYKFLEKFLDVTKSSLLFAKGLILVEGWSEELIVPVIANKLGLNLTDNQISVVNVGNLAFKHYYKIFSRKNGKDMGINISIITDCDIAEYIEEIKDGVKKYKKVNSEEYEIECTEKISEQINNYGTIAKPFISKEWTLEWCLNKSEVLGDLFKEIVIEIHSKSNWADFDKELARKLITRSLNKTEIAYRLSERIDTDKEIDFSDLEGDRHLSYIVEAIKYACK